MSAIQRGKFITLEGGEGVGKSTQLKALAAGLRALGFSVVTTREPGGTAGGEAIRELLMTGEADKWSARAEALLFAAARADHVEKLIEPALARGDWVLCDRYIDSTRAYQGGAGGLPDADILELHRLGAGLMPDRTLYLKLPFTVGTDRAYFRDMEEEDRFMSRGPAYHERLGLIFDDLAQAEPRRIHPIDSSGTPEQVTDRLLAALADYL
jgi:dTMP kinase